MADYGKRPNPNTQTKENQLMQNRPSPAAKPKSTKSDKNSSVMLPNVRQEIGNPNTTQLYGRLWRVRVFASVQESQASLNPNNEQAVNWQQLNAQGHMKVKDEEGNEVKQDTVLDVSDLHVTFEIKHNALGKPAIAHICIHNLNAKTEGLILESGHSVMIEAGYQPQYGIIFEGDIIQVFRNREEGTDYKLEMIAATASDFLGINYCRTSLAAGSTPRQIIETVATQSETSIEIDKVSESITDTPLPRGKVIFGYPGDILNDVAKGNDGFYQVSVEGKLEVRKYTDPIPEDMCISLTPWTGLVGTPEYTDEGINIKMLLNPNVKIHSMIKINNEWIQRKAIDLGNVTNPDLNGGAKVTNQNTVFDQDGEYEVYSLIHSGDTHGEEWFTSVVGIGRNGRAGLPIMVESAEQTVRST